MPRKSAPLHRARWSPHSPALAIAAALALGVSGPVLAAPGGQKAGPDPTLALDRVGTETRLSLVGGAAFHSTTGEILSPRVIALPGGGAVALWEERGADGVRRSFYGMSADGRSVFRSRETTNLVRLRYAEFDPAAGEPGVPEGLAARAGGSTWLVQFASPAIEPMRQAIRDLGGTVHQFMTDHTYVVRLPAGVREQVAALPFVRWVGPYHVAYKLEEPILARAAMERDDGVPARYWVQMIERGPAPQGVVGARVRALGGTVDQTIPQGHLIAATMTPAQLLEIASMDEVLFIDQWGPPSVHMNLAREISGANVIESTLGFNGQGVRAEVMDTGLRTTHLAFSNPTAPFNAPLTHNIIFPDTSHGTRVYGIVFGDGEVVPSGRGVLPGREQGIIASFDILFPPHSVSRYAHCQELVNPSGPYRAVFQTNSWTTLPVTTQYVSQSALLDDIAFDFDFLILNSQGNYGSFPVPQTSAREAWAKNIISVGGIAHKDTLPRADDEWTSASIGPAADGRIKPDLAHFYENVLCPSDTTNTSYDPGMNGTSAACPIVAGHAGLVFQMWHEGVFSGFGGGASVFADRPHFTTVKALLINTAFQYPFTAPTDNLSRDKQGWGMPDLALMLQNTAETFIVNEKDVLTELPPNNSKTYALEVDPGEPRLKVTLVYADPTGTTSATQHRINDLSLRVTSPSGTVYWGNNGLRDGRWSTAGGASNQKDTVENVFIENPEPGFWLVRVSADDINQDGHVETPAIDADFALVAHPAEFSQAVRISLPEGAPTLIASGVNHPIEVTIEAGFQVPDPATAKLYYRFTGAGPFTSAPMTQVGGSGPNYIATIPGPSCGQTPQFYFECKGLAGGTALEPLTAPAAFYAATVGTVVALVDDNFENDNGWTVQSTQPVSGEWERGVPAGGGFNGDPPMDFDESGKCWTTGLAGGFDVDGGPTTLTSPAFALQGFPDARMSYARWAYTNEESETDNLRVQVSNNGSVWTNVESLGDTSAQWVVRSFRVADFIGAPTNQVRLRLLMSDTLTNSTTEGGIDAFKITTVACTNPCYPDCNQSGNLSIADFTCFQTKYAAGDPYADCNASGVLTIADFTCFQTRYVAGCP